MYKEITAQESNDAWQVLIHLEPVRLKEKQMTSCLQFDVTIILYMVTGVMVKIVKTEKKTFLESQGVQRPIEKQANYKSDGTPIGTLMCTLLN